MEFQSMAFEANLVQCKLVGHVSHCKVGRLPVNLSFDGCTVEPARRRGFVGCSCHELVRRCQVCILEWMSQPIHCCIRLFNTSVLCCSGN